MSKRKLGLICATVVLLASACLTAASWNASTKTLTLNGGDTASVTCTGASFTISSVDAKKVSASCLATTTTSTAPPTTTTTQPATPGDCPAWPAVPDASCTGIPTGTNLTTINGAYTVTTAGTVLDSVHITGRLIISADNVTVKNSQIDGNSNDSQPVVQVNGNNITITRSDIGAQDNHLSGHYGIGLYGGGAAVVTNNQFLHEHGAFHIDGGGNVGDSVYIHDNYVFAQIAQSGDHMNIVSSRCGINVTIDHNRFDALPAPGSGGDVAFIMSAYSEDLSCPVTVASPYRHTNPDGTVIHIGAIKNLSYSHNWSNASGSYALWFKDVIGTVSIQNNVIDPSQYGPLAAPDFVPFSGCGNTNLAGVAYVGGPNNC